MQPDMRYGLIFLLILMGLVACREKPRVHFPKAVAVRTDGALELNLMSFNIRYENPADAAERSWSQRSVAAVHLIRQEAPDVFGVQECRHGQAADLWASLPDYRFYGVGRDDGKQGGEYAGIFYQRGRFELDAADCGVLWLSDTPEIVGSKTWGNEFPRIVTWVRLLDRSSERGFYVFNTHWDHKNQYARERSAAMIARRIDARRHSDEPVVLLGDLNAVESNPGVSYLTGKSVSLGGSRQQWKNGMLDTFQVLHADQKDRRTLHFWNRNPSGALKVDHILVAKEARVLKSGIVTRSPQLVVSDHFPVTAKVVFP